jgi:AcrR family transcriptional regulator
MKIPRSTDPRVARTRGALREALLALIVERGWDATGIREICERASIGRSTFYTHFADKEDLLFSGYDDLRRRLRASSAAGRPSAESFGFMRGLLEHAEQNRRMFRALVGKRSSEAAKRRMLQLVIDLVREDIRTLVASSRLEPSVHFLAGALVELLVWWADSRNPLPRAQVESIFREMSSPVLASLRRRSRSGNPFGP